jgi:dethiobiotin synthetase
VELSYDEVNPYAFEEPVAPHIAAAAAGVQIEPGPVEARLARLQRVADRVCVEGVGGWLVPLAGRETVADLAGRLGLDVVLVVGIRLGCLNHTLLTLRAIEASGLRLAGWVANCLPPASAALEENIRSIETFSYAPLLGVVPPLCPVSVEGVAACLSIPARD